ncbi:MAG TPA: hypothetical protein VGI12_05860 [Vicinamibacterales bacterium]
MPVIVAPVSTPRAAAIAAAAFTAAAALLSFGAIAFAGPSPSMLPAGARVGILSLDAWRLALSALAGAIVLAIGWRRPAAQASLLAAVSPLLLVFLPWLPFTVPNAFLIWTGGLLSLVWVVTGTALVGVWQPRVPSVTAASPRAQTVLAGLVSFVVFASAAWFASPSIPGGDEPHYLIITQSLLYDHDLQIENNHRRGDYRAYFAGDLNPDSIRRGRNGAVYSIHAPGLPALLVPAFALGGYHGVVVFLLAVASAACALAWYLAWRVTGSAAAAWFGWAAVAGAAPWILETFTVYPDGPGAAIVLTGFWALLRAEREGREGGEGGEGRSSVRWFIHGLALALLPWMHTRFSVLAATLGGLILVRLAHVPKSLQKAIAFLLPPAVSAIAWLFFFTVLYGTPDPSAPYGGRVDSAFAFLPNGLGGLLFDQGFGLLATAPVLVVAFAGFARARRLALEWCVVALPYLLAVTTFAMWWAGMSGPARFLVPLMLPLAIPAACAWAAATTRGPRMVMLAALLVSIWLSAVMAAAGGGRLGYHTRNEGGATAAPWLEWGTRVVDLPSALPAFVPLPIGTGLQARVAAARNGFGGTLPWIVCLGAAALAAARWIDRRRLAGTRAIAALTAAAAAAVMVAATVVWKVEAAPYSAVAAQMDALRLLAVSRTAAFDLTAPRRIPQAAAWNLSLEVPVAVRAGRGGPRPLNRPLAVFPGVPAGSYLLQVRRHRGLLNTEGWVMAGVGNDQFAIVTQPIGAFDAGVRIDLPVDVRALTVRADEGARDQLDAIALRPVSMASGQAPHETARRAVRYGASVVYFLDDRAFPEPSGFWVGGGRDTTVAAHADRPSPALAILLRNGAADNRVLLETAGWRGDVALKPGEERRIEVPLVAPGTVFLRIRSEAGFRPSDVDGRNTDTRFLGVFVRPE